MEDSKKEIMIKKLLHRSCYRGCKETDLIIGEFAKANLETMDESSMQEFSRILDIDDVDIYDWYTQKKEIPSEFMSETMLKLMNFVPYKK